MKMKKWLMMFLLLALLPFSAGQAENAAGNHLVFQAVDQGSCRDMTGEIVIQFVFVDGDDGVWPESAMAEYRKMMEDVSDYLVRQAGAYGKEMQISLRYAHTAETMALDTDAVDAWADHVLANAGLPSRTDTSVYVQEGMPLIFLVNEGGRAFSCANAGETYNDYLICFNTTVAASFPHELLHLYGAVDYYYPLAYREAAEKYFPDSIMLSVEEEKTVDHLTAWLIGWTDAPDADARAFLEETAHVQAENLETALKESLFTGFGAQETEHYTYTGDWVMGAWDGKGVLEWKNGARYEGDFSGGLRNGRGVMTLSDGETYAGEYKNDKKQGYGVLVWGDLGLYAGNFENDMARGQGVRILNDGSLYAGNLESWELWGRGTKIGAGGAVYTGELQQSIPHGYGTQVWPDGLVYRGDWIQGRRTGEGIMLWPDGSLYTGGFEDDAINGYGVYLDAAGNVYKGNWIDGVLSAE